MDIGTTNPDMALQIPVVDLGVGLLSAILIFLIFAGLAGVIYLLYLDRRYPKVNFIIEHKGDMYIQSLRVVGGIPTDKNIIDCLLFGHGIIGFPIDMFRKVYFHGKPYYRATHVYGIDIPDKFIEGKIKEAEIKEIKQLPIFPQLNLPFISKKIEEINKNKTRVATVLAPLDADFSKVTERDVGTGRDITIRFVQAKLQQEEVLSKNAPFMLQVMHLLAMLAVAAGFIGLIYVGFTLSKGLTENLLEISKTVYETYKSVPDAVNITISNSTCEVVQTRYVDVRQIQHPQINATGGIK